MSGNLHLSSIQFGDFPAIAVFDETIGYGHLLHVAYRISPGERVGVLQTRSSHVSAHPSGTVPGSLQT